MAVRGAGFRGRSGGVPGVLGDIFTVCGPGPESLNRLYIGKIIWGVKKITNISAIRRFGNSQLKFVSEKACFLNCGSKIPQFTQFTIPGEPPGFVSGRAKSGKYARAS